MAERVIDILAPTLGVFTDRPAWQVPVRGCSSARNVRVRDGHLTRDAMGWSPFFDLVLDGPVLLVTSFRMRTGTRTTILGTARDLYRLDAGSGTVTFLTPRYETGTVSSSGTTVVGVGTAFVTAGIAAGDRFHFHDAGETDPDATWYEVDSVVSETVLELTAAGPSTVTVPYTIRKVFTGTRLDVWQSATYYGAAAPDVDRWYATNGVEVPVVWNGNDDQVTELDALGFTCRWLVAFKGMMIYGNLTESGETKADRIRCSAIGEPENVTTSGAAELAATSISDVLLAAAPLGDLLITYGQHGSVNAMQFVGPPIVFAIRTASLFHGILSSRALVDRGTVHEIMTLDGPCRFDGVEVAPYGLHAMRDVVRALDPMRHPQVIGAIDRERGEVHWILPLLVVDGDDSATAYPTTAYTEFYLESGDVIPIIPRDLPATAIGLSDRESSLRFSDIDETFAETGGLRFSDRFFQQGFADKVFGDATGALYLLGGSDSKAGLPIASHARLGRVPLANGSARGLLTRIEVAAEKVVDAPYALGVRVLTADQAETGGTEAAALGYDLSQEGARFLTPRVQARFAEIELSTEGVGESWSVSGIRLVTAPTGGWR